MQIQPQSQVNFTAIYPFKTPQKRAAIIRMLDKEGITYKIDEGQIYTGRNIKDYIERQVSKFKEIVNAEHLESSVERSIAEFRAARRKK